MHRLSVSVIIPAYRAARTIRRAVESVFGQTQGPAEVLVVDDGSPDGGDLTAALSRYGDRVTVLRKSNGGAASARNHGIERARGNVIGFLDADDYWEPNKLQRQLDLLERHPDVGLTSSRWYTEQPGQPRTPPGTSLDDIVDRAWAPVGPDVFRVACQVSTPTVLVRRNVLGSHRFPRDLRTGEDRDLWCRLVAAAPVYLSSAPLATVVLEPGSLSRTNVNQDYANMLRVVHRHADLLGRQVRAWEASTYRSWAGQLLSDGRPSEALRPAVQRLRRRPLSLEGWYVLGKCLARCIRQRTFSTPALESA